MIWERVTHHRLALGAAIHQNFSESLISQKGLFYCPLEISRFATA